MNLHKIISFILCVAILTSAMLTQPVFADSNTKELTQRKVYLHAFDEKREVTETVNNCTVYMGDPVNIYFAVDDPNKSRSSDEPQFDMTGYTVKIYFDTKYFVFDDNYKSTPLDYKYPNDMGTLEEDDIIKDSEADSAASSDGSNDPTADSSANQDETSKKPGYFLWRHEESDDITNRTGYACATVFLLSDGSDNLYSTFPEEQDGDKYWYNLCRLPLVARQPGYTSVYIDVDTNDEYTLELFAKNHTPDDALNFDCTAVNDGIFYLSIDDKNKPKPPRPDDDHPAGTYNDAIEIGLQHDNKDECEIWYSTDGITDPRTQKSQKAFEFLPGDVISLTGRTVVMAATKRVSDGKWSDVRQYVYEFTPRPPYLFNSEKKLIPNIYSEVWQEGGYSVSASDSTDYNDVISNTIYYTFHPSLSVDKITDQGSTDASTGWKKATAGYIAEKITDECTMRLVSVNNWGVSDVAVYHLSVKPDVVTAVPGSGLDREQPIALECVTPGAQIYYTTDGGDPRNSGVLYTGAITLEADTVVKAAAKLGNQWGSVTSYWYLFSNTNRSGVSAFSPAGTYVGNVEVTLYPNEPGKEIQISEDGITWTNYDGKTMVIDEYTRFRARIKDDSNPDDKGDEFVYVIKPRPPVFSPEGTQFTSSDTVTVFCPEVEGDSSKDYELWYTTDGTEPTADDKAPSTTVNINITDYTTVKAVIVKDGQYKSDTVTHTYGVVYGKPASPLTTLLPGFYDRKVGSEGYTTQFKEVPDGTEIYYTISTGDDCTYPDVNNPGAETGTYIYNGETIEVIDSMIINAVAVRTINGAKVKSENASFHYLITPEAPKAAPSAIVGELGVIPVDAVTVFSNGKKRSEIHYTIGNDNEGYYTGSFYNDYTDPAYAEDTVRFYVDLSTGRAYRDLDCTHALVEPTGKTFTESVILNLSETLDGVNSGDKAYIYSLDAASRALIAPYADKDSGFYVESKSDFEVKLYSVYKPEDNVKIQWRTSGDSNWHDYNNVCVPLITYDTILYIRTVDNADSENCSQSVGYVYYFMPPAPIITPISGTYAESDATKISIKQSPDRPDEVYYLYYSHSVEPGWGGPTRAEEYNSYVIDTTKTVRAYVKNDRTGRLSEVVYQSYITESDSVLSGAVSIKSPYNKKRISAHLLGSGEYAKGVQFDPATGVLYNYQYDFIPEAGISGYESEESVIYNEANAFIPTQLMDSLSINVWLDGDRLGTQRFHTIDFVHLEKPGIKTSNPPESGNTYPSGTKYQLVNHYKDDPSYIVFYTTDGSDPASATSSRSKFSGSEFGPELPIKSSTVVRAVYYSACKSAGCDACKNGNYENCPDHVYGAEATYNLNIEKKVVSGGGGGGTIDKTRKYTSDIFGTEHPTHIGYINGYPDGSVRPDGNITREEISAILYRIKPRAYDAPIETTGTVFPDVALDRWSVREIEHLTAYEIIKGYPDGSFKPSGKLTRAEFAALIRRFIDSAEIKMANNKVTLSDIENHWAYDDITFIAKAGLVEGYEDGTFRPEREITRAEVMSVINRILGRRPLDSYVKSQDFNPFNDLEADKWYYVAVLEATITHDYYLNIQNYEHKWDNWK